MPVWVLGDIVVYLMIRLGLLRSLNLIGFSPSWAKIIGLFLLIPSTRLTVWARFSLGTMWSAWPEAKMATSFAPKDPTGSPAIPSTPVS